MESAATREEVICKDAAGAAHHLVQGLCRTYPGQQPTLREGVARASNKRASPFGLAPGTCAAAPSEAQRELELSTTLHLNRDISQVAHFRYRSIRPRVFARGSLQLWASSGWQPGEDLPVTRRIAHRVQIRICLDPGAESAAGIDGAIEEVQRSLQIPGVRKAAGGVVEHREIVRLERHGLLQSLDPLLPLPQIDQRARGEVQGAHVVRAVFKNAIGGREGALAGAVVGSLVAHPF